jgi:hypothetical protein
VDAPPSLAFNRSRLLTFLLVLRVRKPPSFALIAPLCADHFKAGAHRRADPAHGPEAERRAAECRDEGGLAQLIVVLKIDLSGFTKMGPGGW